MKRLISPIILGVSGVAVLLWLGFWQVGRLEWKENLINQIGSKLVSEPVPYDGVAVNYQPVIITGVLSDPYVDILSGSQDSQAFYRRIYSLDTDHGRIMLEVGGLPQVTKDTGVTLPESVITVSANVYRPEEASKSQPDLARNVWVGYNLPAMAETLQTQPILLIAKASPVEGISDRPLDAKLVNNHLQYAITWFSLALVWCMMAAYWGYTRMKENRN